MQILPVILSGGAGTRLWPESRKSFPKPFMTMPDGETLIEKTLYRAEALAEGGPILTVTNQGYLDLAREAYTKAATGNNRHAFLLEPQARNTAPAIAMAAAWAQQELGGDVCLVILPSDHLIADLSGFVAAAKIAAELASQDFLVTFGIRPTRPETGYGYIKAGDSVGEGFSVERFVEKPDLSTAEAYLESGQFLWNSGMFAFTSRGFSAATKAVAPELDHGVSECLKCSSTSSDEVRLDQTSFAQLPSISVDYAVFEKSENVAVVAGEFDWNDVGSWQAISELNPAGSNHSQNEAIFVDSQDVYVRNNQKLVATIGVKDLVVVDTPDALLISEKSRSQDVKAVVEQLKAQQSTLTEIHRNQGRWWDQGECLWSDAGQEIYRVTVETGSQLTPPTGETASQFIVLSGNGLGPVGTATAFVDPIANTGNEGVTLLVVVTSR